MNAGLSKIHFVNTTGVSLNDRFTTMTKPTVGFGAAPAIVEAPRPRANSVTRATESNRRLVDQWDQLHALQALGVKVRTWFTHIAGMVFPKVNILYFACVFHSRLSLLFVPLASGCSATTHLLNM